MSEGPISAAETALLLVDLQNDFIHPNGAYGRAGQGAAEIAALPARLAPLAQALRAAGGWIAATQFTLVPAKGGAPIIAPHLHKLRPFLAKGDFTPHGWGHAIVVELQPIGYCANAAFAACWSPASSPMAASPPLCGMRMCGITRSPYCPMAAPPSPPPRMM